MVLRGCDAGEHVAQEPDPARLVGVAQQRELLRPRVRRERRVQGVLRPQGEAVARRLPLLRHLHTVCSLAASPSIAIVQVLGVLGRPVLVQNLEVVDVLRVPKVKPGRYVLQWRWDAERSDQIWSNCADINIV